MATVAAHAGRIAWVGFERDVPDLRAPAVQDLQGRWITPGPVDCHTHLL